MRRAKIVCTMGPAVESPEKVKELIEYIKKGKPSAVSQSQQQQKKTLEEAKTSPILGNVKPNPDTQVAQANIQMI